MAVSRARVLGASPNPLTRAGVQKHIVGSQERRIFLGLLVLQVGLPANGVI